MFFILIWEMVISEKLLRCIKHFTVYKLHLNQVLFKNKIRYYTQPQGVNLLRVTRMLKFQKSYYNLKKRFIGCGLREEKQRIGKFIPSVVNGMRICLETVISNIHGRISKTIFSEPEAVYASCG